MSALRRTSALAPALAVAMMASLASNDVHATPIALTGGTVHTVSGPVLDGATVVIDDGKIVAVGKDVSPPAGATVVSCAGKHVYPGFIAAVSVLGLVEVNSVRGTVDYQETGDINPNIRAEAGMNPESELIPVARVNGITSAMIVPRGGAIAGTPALIHLDGWTFEDMTVRAPMGLFVQWPNMTPVQAFFEERSDDEQKKARDRQLAALRKAFDDARAYAQARDAEKTSGIPRHDRDLKYDAVARAVRGEIPVLFQANTLAQIKSVLSFADEQKLTKIVLVGGNDAWRVADELKARNIPVITGSMYNLPARRSDPYDASFALPSKLAQAGVRYCISDGGTAFGAMNSRNLPYNAAMASAFGLSRDDALKSITLYPAQILGVADRLGSIEVGKVADLFIADGDPLEIATHVEQVYIAGKPISMETRQTRLFEKYDHRPRGPKARKK